MVDLKLSEYFNDIYSVNEGIPEFEMLVNGEWINSDKKQDVVSSLDGSVIGRISVANHDNIDSMVNHAVEAQKEIEKMSLIDRIELLNKVKSEVISKKDELVNIIMIEAGKPKSAAEGEITTLIRRLELSEQDLYSLKGEFIPGDLAQDTVGRSAVLVRKPIGVVLGISPFNYPVYTSANKIIPAILGGNSIIIKPPSADPIALLALAEIFRKAGMPKGVLQVVTGSGSSTGDYLIENNQINMISFTGSTEVGEHITNVAGIKKLHMELGGKAPAIILKDADLDLAAKECVKGSLSLSGQRCDAISRILVVEDVYSKFVEKLKEHMSDFKMGNPIENNSVNMGPLINKKAAERIDSMVKDAISKGCNLVQGGKYNNCYYEPTLLTDVTKDSIIANEETFGPVVTVIKVKDIDDAIEVSNNSKYGLDGCVFTNNISEAFKVMDKVKVGNMSLNVAPSHGTSNFPFGGIKSSGEGKEGIGKSIEEMTVVKTLIFDLSSFGLGKEYSGKFN